MLEITTINKIPPQTAPEKISDHDIALRDMLMQVMDGAAATSELPSGIDGLDMAEALRCVLGNKLCYLSMLRRFAVGHKFTLFDLCKALDGIDWSTAERLAHTLKSVSGSIGAVVVQYLAEKLEFGIKARLPRVELDALLFALKTPLENLLEQLEQKLPKEQGMRMVTVDPEKLKAVCDKLYTLLADNDFIAIEEMEAHADLLCTAFPDHYRKLDQSMRSFDLAAALAALRNAITTRNTDEN